MAKKNTNNKNMDNLYKLNASPTVRGVKPNEPVLTIDQLIAEGDLILAQESKEKNKKSVEPLPKSKDYYRQARLQLLKGMDFKKIRMLQTMEKEHDTNNNIYQNFVDEIIKLGDKISNQ